MSDKLARKVKKDLNIKTVVIVAVLVLVLAFAGVFAFLHFYHSNIIGDNVYVNSLHIGGLTVDEAAAKIDQEFNEEYFDKTVQITYEDKTCEVDLLKFVKIDSNKTAKNAFDKSGSVFNKISGKDKIVVPFELVVDREALENDIKYFCLNVEDKYGVFSFNDDYTSVSVDASKIDEIMSIEKTIEVVLENIKNDKYSKVTPVVIKKDDKDFAEELYNRINRMAKDASVGMNEDESTYIVPEVVGIKADKNNFLNLYEEKKGIFTMDVEPLYPKIRTSDLDIEFYQDVLGTYTSPYDMGLVNRTKNLSLAAKFVNGTIIMPGKRFSYNSVVGKRTYERGFVDATVYTGEGTEEGIGGGICQVSSTIYCAQLRANLKTIARTNHSYTVVYVPLGQDATVVYGALDYIFENDTNYPIRIDAYASGGYLTVKIMGTKVDKSLTYDVVSITNSTIPKQEVQKETPDLPVGKTEVKQNGQNGAVVSTYKIYYKDGVEQKREYIGNSKYIAMNKIVLVGTGEPEPEENTEADAPTDVDGAEDNETSTPDASVDVEDNTDYEENIEENVEDETDIPTSDTGL
ncbi:MAG: VanW family protein [Clostridia bacterium]|nr:VanW family protein [Clostridia bacterium]